MSIEQNKALVRRLFEALNAGVEATSAICPEIFAGQPFDNTTYAELDALLMIAMPDMRFTIEELLADGDTVVARFTTHGAQTRAFQGIPATGAAVTASGIAIYRLAGGKIVEQWLEYDRLGTLQQLGVIPALAPLQSAIAE
jgi:predicted ester cyclase